LLRRGGVGANSQTVSDTVEEWAAHAAPPISIQTNLLTGPRTYSASHIDRHRAAHVREDGYGRHRHLYLQETIRQLARSLGSAENQGLSWLDYGCGKGGFIEQIRPLSLFATIVGFDPAVSGFSSRPAGRFDLVTCLDVIDIVEPRYLGAVVQDAATFTRGVAVFDCLTRPKTAALRPHSPLYWTQIIRQHMEVVETRVEFPGMDGFERVVIIASRRSD
jgi:hypothetical protein